MALLEGAMRIKLVGLGVVIGGMLNRIRSWMLNLVNARSGILIMIGFALFLGGVIFAFGWVIEGFAQPAAKHPSDQSPVTGNH
jgi:hypothetical protein